ncbi:MAG: MFS transporter [Christensenellales bacterium]
MKTASKIIHLVNNISLGLMIPVLSLMLLDKGSSLSGLALVLGVYSLCVFLFEIPSGILADLLGRKRVFLLSCIFNMVSAAALLFLHGWRIIFGIVFWGMGKAFASGSFDALVIDRVVAEKGPDHLPAVTGELALIETLGIAGGAVLGGVLPGLSKSMLPFLGTYDLNLLAKCLLCGVTALLAAVYLKEAPVAAQKRTSLKSHLKESAAFLKENRTVRLLILGVFFGGVFISTVEAYWQPVFMGFAGEGMGWALGIVSFACFGFASLGSIVMKKALCLRQGIRLRLYHSARILLALCLVVFALQRSAAGFAAVFVVVYFLFAAANVAESTLINHELPCSIRASFLSLVSFAFQGGAMAASPFCSIIVQYQGIEALWIATGILLLCVSVFIGFRLRAGRRKKAALP